VVAMISCIACVIEASGLPGDACGHKGVSSGRAELMGACCHEMLGPIFGDLGNPQSVTGDRCGSKELVIELVLDDPLIIEMAELVDAVLFRLGRVYISL
jgi:hypothetical protein